jgi:hypothetical protein
VADLNALAAELRAEAVSARKRARDTERRKVMLREEGYAAGLDAAADRLDAALNAAPGAGFVAPADTTAAMEDAGLQWLTGFAHMRKQDRRNAISNAYRAMLAAAPRQDAAAQEPNRD